MADNNQPQAAQQPQQDELIRGVVGCFHTLSGNKTRIVYTNVFTGKLHVKERGLFFNFPWRIRPVTVSLDQQKVDTAERMTHTASTGTSTGPSVSYDTDYFLKIVDPVKFVESAESMSASAIRKTIGDLLDQKIRDYIITQDYATLMQQGAFNFAAQLNLGTPSLATQILNDYGVEVRNIMFRVKPPKNLVEEANKTAHARQAQQTAREEAERQRLEAEGKARVTEITADAEKKRIEAEGAALAQNMQRWIAAGMTNEQIAQKLANEALTNGTNPNTFVFANAGQQMGTDMSALFAMVTAAMRQQQQMQQGNGMGAVNNGNQQSVQQSNNAGATNNGNQQNSTVPDTIDWDSLNDDEYLTAEDSAALAAERGQRILERGRYHISLLTSAEKQRYVVASQKGRTR